MNILQKYEIWFVTGSQFLYGEETLKQVESHSLEITEYFKQKGLPLKIVYKPIVKTADEITELMKEASYKDECAGLITWMHTFSPSKMWINGLKQMKKPLLHLHTQYNRQIPVDKIDMDFMNTNQSAHGDREHGFIMSRLRMNRKVVVGYYKDQTVLDKIASWMRAAVGVAESQSLKAIRFGDNMREVAVTEGDKVEAQIKFGWQVNTYGVGRLVEEIEKISEAEMLAAYDKYSNLYEFATDNNEAIQYQIKVELALEHFLKKNECTAFTTTFEDLYGLKQLPGMACQNLMRKGYGFGGEGDWKVSCMTRIMKCMAEGVGKGTTFMEDYTYHFSEEDELVLGAHMLEVCPSIAAKKPKVIVKPLGIGGKEAPARIVFDGKEGEAICVSLVDMGGRMRLIVADVTCVKPIASMPNLPVACTMWKPHPNLKVSSEAWILAGGAHHSVLSYDLTAEEMRDFAEILGVEFVHINQDTKIEQIKKDLLLGDLVWKLN